MEKWMTAAGLLLLSAAILAGCQKAPQEQVLPTKVTAPAAQTAPTETPPSEMPPCDTVPATQESEWEGELVAQADTLEQAQEIAGLYGIQLLHYEYGIAVYTTQEDPDAVIQRGMENGWPLLERNFPVTAF